MKKRRVDEKKKSFCTSPLHNLDLLLRRHLLLQRHDVGSDVLDLVPLPDLGFSGSLGTSTIRISALGRRPIMYVCYFLCPRSPREVTKCGAWQTRQTLLRLRHRPTYLLRGHRGITVHSFEDLLLGLAVRAGRILRDLGSVNSGLRSVVLLLGEWVISEGRVIGRSHMMLWWLLLLCMGRVLLLRGYELVVGCRRGCPALPRRPFCCMACCFFSRDDVN